MPVLQIKTFRQKAGKVETSHYKASISRLRARLVTGISYNTLKGDVRVEGFPDVCILKITTKRIENLKICFNSQIRITLNSIGAIKTLDQDEKQLQEVISEVLSNAIRDSVYPIDFSVYSTCPRAIEMEAPEIPVNFPTHYDSLAVRHARRLHIKKKKKLNKEFTFTRSYICHSCWKLRIMHAKPSQTYTHFFPLVFSI